MLLFLWSLSPCLWLACILIDSSRCAHYWGAVQLKPTVQACKCGPLVIQETSSPPPDERQFVDDDGTHFTWDASVRKFVPNDLPFPTPAPAEAPAGTAAAATSAPPTGTQLAGAGFAVQEYPPEMMRFAGSDEVVVTLEQARAAEAASEELAAKLHEAQAQGTKVCC